MDIKELVIGQWYVVPCYSAVFQFGGILDENRIKLNHLFFRKRNHCNNTTTNERFWEECRVLLYEDIENLIPKKDHHLIMIKSHELWI